MLPDGTPYPSAGRFQRAWIERNLVHGEGDVLGDPVRLSLVWEWIIERIYQYNPDTGRFLYDRILIGMGKGNVKTESIADLGLTELDGPLAPVSPNVPISAASWENANRLFGAARLSILGDSGLKQSPLAATFHEGREILEDRIVLPDEVGRLYRTAAVAGTNDGGLPTCYLGDELHEWVTDRAIRMWTVQGKSLRKRRIPRRLKPAIAKALGVPVLYGGFQIGITTTGADRDSLLGDLYAHGVAVAKGETTDPGFLFLWWEADEKWDLEDPEQRRQAILEGNPTCPEVLPFENIEASFFDPTVPRSEFIRYNLNRWPDLEERWMPQVTWDATHGQVVLDPKLAVYSAVVIAHDHLTGAIASAQNQESGVVVRVTHYPERPLPPGDYLDITDLEKDLDLLRERYPSPVLVPRVIRPGYPEKILPNPGPEIVYTGAFFEGSAQRLRAKGAAMVDLPNSAERLAPAAETLKRLASEGRLTHERDDLLSQEVGFTVARQAPAGWFIAPRAGKQITGALAMIVAVQRAVVAPRYGARKVLSMRR